MPDTSQPSDQPQGHRPPNDAAQPTRFDRIRRIFAEAMEQPADERPAFLDHACAGDADLRHEVDSLIHVARPTQHRPPTPGAAAAHIQTGGVAHAVAAAIGEAVPPIAPPTKFAPSPLTERPGTIIGPYKLLEAIGEGGFGTVFLADQTAPVRRRVALKVIKLGMDTKQVVARFEAERQALALMDHPNIAKVFDAGATELTASGGGRPYFVMEYVKGDPITLFADAHRLTLRERLELLMQVCNAVQHAHQKGVIHRDIKPSNVLVSMVDGKPLAKVIDFGIAKATGAAGGTLTDKTLFTEHRALIGTPEYMSPEQAEGSPDIDTRTDVYGLGVLMYELLTGTTPFEPSRLRSAAHAEMQRIIKEEDPPSPSLRITRDVQRDLKKLASTAAQRKVEPQKLNALMRGELDWIVMKALDKDRGRRFSTPQDLAADVDRHLRGEAVVAAPPSAAYRVRKFVRKNKRAASVIGAIAVVMLVSAVAIGIFALETKRARTELEDLLAFSACARADVWQEPSTIGTNLIVSGQLSAAAMRHIARIPAVTSVTFDNDADFSEAEILESLRRLTAEGSPFKAVTSLDLWNKKVTDAGVRLLARADTGLKALTSLDLGSTDVTDAGVKDLARADTGLKALTKLDLGGTKVTDAGVKDLTRADTGLKALTLLLLRDTKITDAAVKELARADTGLKALTKLDLGGTKVTDAGVKDLARADTALEALTLLHLSGTKVTDAGVRDLACAGTGLKALTDLGLWDTQVTDAGLQALARADTGLSALAELRIWNTRVTDAGIKDLARADTGLKALRLLSLNGTTVTDEGVAAVKARFPGIKIIR